MLLAPAVTPPTVQLAHPAATLSAAVQDLGMDLLDPVVGLAQQFDPGVVADAAITAPASIATSIGDAIENLYLTVEPWVRYGVTVAQWAVGWVPFVGLLAPQLTIFYDLGESVVQSGLFNTIDVLDGSVGFFQGLSNFGADTAAAFNTFITDQINWVLHFLPPFPPLALSTDGLLDAASSFTDATAATDVLSSLFDAGALGDLGGLFDFSPLSELGSDLGGLLLGLIP
ncbi:hypothetical protein C1Y40_01114 [Mycobacterium talmoniae]|uniref:Uncharacterized protein n=1 Tax=Mycobacterium talmoniae TaxID=1858794 RepID=A0A2S8BPW6_9MYCO|nr:hypothetical protein C1Y40_01114 [Mycobacterium talmoniae]